MYKNKKFLAIIPARSGSKGLKDKNVRQLKGKPMIAYTIEAAKDSKIFDEIIVSTDSEKYARISEEYGASVPFLRPMDLATDKSTSSDVILHTINELQKIGLKYDYFMLLQPTSPLRDTNDIINSVDLLFNKEANSIVSVTKVEHSPHLMNELDDSLSMVDFLESKYNKRRQELPSYYRLNGAIYLSNVDFYKKHNSYYKQKSYAYIMSNINSIDVDSFLDFQYVNTIMENKFNERS
ncbi:acylneuraminate cytidylyltransferase family protein [Oceanobacillus picturae]|uniref:acylneuraminate cytidylyltransferase family protein n=1 Tax=Oceanobacillus picturae TaxID=171693 RepID=UPI0036420B76